MIVCEIFFSFYIFVNSSNCSKQSYFDWNFLYPSKKTFQANLESLSISNMDLSEKIGKMLSNKTNFKTFFTTYFF